MVGIVSNVLTGMVASSVIIFPLSKKLLSGTYHGRYVARPHTACAHHCFAGSTDAFDSVDKVDPSSAHLMHTMWLHFRHNMEVINFWLSTCVLKDDMKQYSSRLVATAWHLAQNPTGNVLGFSGTNDNHMLLPLQVRQVTLNTAPELEGTNGKMLSMLLQHARYATLRPRTKLSEADGGLNQQVCAQPWWLARLCFHAKWHSRGSSKGAQEKEIQLRRQSKLNSAGSSYSV